MKNNIFVVNGSSPMISFLYKKSNLCRRWSSAINFDNLLVINRFIIENGHVNQVNN